MASVYRENRNGNASYVVSWLDETKTRRRLRLTTGGEREARAMAARIEAIIGARVAGEHLDKPTHAWIAKLPDPFTLGQTRTVPRTCPRHLVIIHRQLRGEPSGCSGQHGPQLA